jgi:hypothetical protein
MPVMSCLGEIGTPPADRAEALPQKHDLIIDLKGQL